MRIAMFRTESSQFLLTPDGHVPHRILTRHLRKLYKKVWAIGRLPPALCGISATYLLQEGTSKQVAEHPCRVMQVSVRRSTPTVTHLQML